MKCLSLEGGGILSSGHSMFALTRMDLDGWNCRWTIFELCGRQVWCFFNLLPADVEISVNYCEEVYERHFKKSKDVYVAKQFIHAIFKAAQAHN